MQAGKTPVHIKFKNEPCLSTLESKTRAGEVAQGLKALTALPEVNSQQQHGGSLPSVVKAGDLFWPEAYMQAEYCIHNK